MPRRVELGAGEPDPEFVNALRRAIERSLGRIQPCPDCAGTGRDWRGFDYCRRCDGAGEIRVAA
jgi:DnaJ-class molecular chaperone